jgi:hypothetical protein
MSANKINVRVLQGFVRQAVKLNRTKGDPSMRR